MVRRINLVPAEERRRTQTDIGLLGLAVAVAAVIGGMAFSYFYFSGVASEREMELALTQAQRVQVEAQLVALSEFEVLQQQVQANEALVQQIYSGRTLVSEVLGDLSLVVPPEVWFDVLEVAAPPLSTGAATAAAPGAAPAGPAMGSVAMRGTTYTFEDVAQLLVRLDQVASLTGISLGTADSSKIGASKVKSFDVSSQLFNTQSPTAPLPITAVEVKG